MEKFVDNYRHKGMRRKLVDDLKRKGIRNKAILKAILDIPRHYFIDTAFSDWAYKDVAFPIDAAQTISQPYTVAIQTQLLDVKKGDRILEIGTGSGYQACVLAYIGAKVYTIERIEKLYKKTSELLSIIGFKQVRTLFGDGFKGAPRFAPFDKILITAGAKKIPEELLDQLKDGGYLVIPLDSGDHQVMLRIIRTGDNFIKEKHGHFRFVPMLHGINREPEV